MSSALRQQQAAATLKDKRWAAVVARDISADGKFYYSVATTGVYCRPACAARLARPENVRFHVSCEDAERAGFRACLRCKPREPALHTQHSTLVTDACRRLASSEVTPSLAELARYAGLSPWHFHRVFKSITGLTPKAYAQAHRATRVRSALVRQASVTDALFEAGYNASSRFYEDANKVLGMRPSTFRAGGINTEIRFAVGECSLGAILVAASPQGVCAIFLGEDPHALVREVQDRFPHATLIGADRAFERLVARVVGFVDDPSRGLDLPLDVRGTAFQQRVWRALQKIRAGSTATYADIARRIGAPTAVRAVAGACGANMLAVAIPCHRVVRTDGSLSGYRWGVARKRQLLAREAPDER